MPASMRFRRARRLRTLYLILATLAPFALLIDFAGPGLFSGFSHDDLMNLHGARVGPLSSILIDLIAFFRYSDTYRPLGALLYRVIFELCGFQPLLFHMAGYLLICLNLGLLAVFVRRLTGSMEAAALTSLIHGYHGNFAPLDVNAGFYYDLLCFTFYFGAFALYLGIRQQHRYLTIRQTAVWCALFILALNAKEMAVTLPVLILAYELLREPPRTWRWLLSQPVVLLGALISTAFIAGRLRGQTALLSFPTYQPDIRLSIFVDRMSSFLMELTYGRPWHHGSFGWAVMAIIVAYVLTTSRHILMGAILTVVGILPVAFIFQRSIAQAYIPLAGLALCLAVSAARLGQLAWWLTGRLPGSARLSFPIRRFVTLAIVAATLAFWHHRHGRIDFHDALAESREIHHIMSQLKAAYPSLPGNARILFRADPFPRFPYNSLFLIRNAYDSNTIEVFRLDRSDLPADSQFDFVLAYQDGLLLDCRQKRCPYATLDDYP